MGFPERTAQFSGWKTTGKDSSEACAIACQNRAVYSVFFLQVWRHTVKSLSLTETVYGTKSIGSLYLKFLEISVLCTAVLQTWELNSCPTGNNQPRKTSTQPQRSVPSYRRLLVRPYCSCRLSEGRQLVRFLWSIHTPRLTAYVMGQELDTASIEWEHDCFCCWCSSLEVRSSSLLISRLQYKLCCWTYRRNLTVAVLHLR